MKKQTEQAPKKKESKNQTKKDVKRSEKDLEKKFVQIGGLKDNFARQIQKEVHRAAKVAPMLPPKTSLHSWLRAVAHPFKGRNIPCPVNFAPAPSVMSSNCTVTGNIKLTIHAGKSTQVVLFPGHSGPPKSYATPTVIGAGPATYPMPLGSVDGTSFHCRLMNMKDSTGGTARPYTPGPLHDTHGYVHAALGGYVENITGDVLNGYCSDATRIAPDVQIPYQTTLGDDNRHVRWRLDSMGIRFETTTPGGTRGIQIQSVQLANASGIPHNVPMVRLESNPTYKLWTEDQGELSWIPRLQDLAYWHAVGSGDAPGAGLTAPINNDTVYQQDFSSAAIVLYLSALTTEQTVTVQIIQNFSLAGPLVNSIAGRSPNMPEAKPVVEHVVAEAQNFSSTMAGAVQTGREVINQLSKGAEFVGSVTRAASSLARSGFSI